MSEATSFRKERNRKDAFVSVVLPVFNEAAVLHELTTALTDVTEQHCRDFEVVFVNDGSTDSTRDTLDELAADDHRIVVVHLARNFGHQAALHAGLEQARGDVVVVMDSDMQDDPAAVPVFLDEWERNCDVVYAERFNRKESAPKRALFYGFYRLLNAVAEQTMPADAGNFGLLDRRVVTAILRLQERERYFPGLRNWVGFRQKGVAVERLARHDEQPRVSLMGLCKLAKTAIFAFSSFPLTAFYVIAAISALVCCGSVGFVVYHKMFTGLAIPGWASMIVTASFFGALNALGISVLGEYVIRIYDQVRSRPVYVVDERRNAEPAQAADSRVDRTVERLLKEIDHELNLRPGDNLNVSSTRHFSS